MIAKWHRRQRGLLLLLALALLWGSAGCSNRSRPAAAVPLPNVNGTIAAGEYQHHYHNDQTGIDLYWTIAGKLIYFGLTSTKQGWVALGLDPDGPMMQGSDILIGYVKDGQTYMSDEYSDTPTSHTADTRLGGRDDILEMAGSEGAQGTTLEFSRKLKTGDEHDKAITPGRHTVLLAYSDADDITSYHGQGGKLRAIAFIDFFKPKEAK